MTNRKVQLNQIDRVEFISGAVRREITTRDQFDRMVEFMIENPIFATFNEETKNSEMYKTLWKKLSIQLNKRGPPMRTTAKWKQVWTVYKKKINQKCIIANNIKQKNQRIRDAGGTGNYKEVMLNKNEIAIKKLIFDPPIDHINIGSNVIPKHSINSNINAATSTSNMQEEALHTIKTEPFDMFINTTDATKELQLVDTTVLSKRSVNNDKWSTTYPTQNQVNVVDDNIEIEKQLDKLRNAKLKISRQTAEIKQKQLELKEKLQKLKEHKFELKCQQLKYKAQKLDLQKKELQMKEAAKLRNSINTKFKKIF